jgi:glycerol-3-phosphate dehydrogenase
VEEGLSSESTGLARTQRRPVVPVMTREAHLARLGEPFDLVVIGGGATGLGCAVDAASRGHTVALFEARDFAQGTSSRSTKLVHGGLRYLAQADFGLVYEALHERGRLIRNAPHLVHPLGFILPTESFFSRTWYGTGLFLYDVLAGRAKIVKHRRLSTDEVISRIPNIRRDRVRGGLLYADAQFNDTRLAVSLVRTAVSYGAVALNHTPVVGLLRHEGKVAGVVVRDEETGRTHEVRAKVVVNATGVFADAVRTMDEPSARPMLKPSRGVHLVLPAEFLGGSDALVIPKTPDGRVMFVIPFLGKALLGTTDTATEGLEVEPRATEAEIDFLLETARPYLAKVPTRQDVLSIFAGLRPLVGHGHSQETRSISREHTLLTSKGGLITITGGKWTTYRKMAQQTVDAAEKTGGLERRECVTMEMPLEDSPLAPSEGDPELRGYGTHADEVSALSAGQGPLHPRLPYTLGQVQWAAREEMARTIDDVLARRTRALFLDARAAVERAPLVAQTLATELRRPPQWVAEQLAAFQRLAEVFGASAERGQPMTA